MIIGIVLRMIMSCQNKLENSLRKITQTKLKTKKLYICSWQLKMENQIINPQKIIIL